MSAALQAVALMGATGTGKSALAMQVAKATGMSIICCDSMQLYSGLDIGTAKPTVDERTQVEHFLVDCCELPDLYSAARWANEARIHIRAQNALGKVPIIVGGTGLYLKALTQGFADIPEEKPEVRAHLEAVQNALGTAELYRLLQACDPDMALRLKENDTQRIMRALSVYESSGKALSVWQKQAADIPAIDCPVFVLDVARDVLRQRLADRFDVMMSDGWMEEVKWLDALQLPDTHPTMRAVGYRQLLDHLHGDLSVDKALTDGITATRRYAKRQVTWFNHQAKDAIHGDAQAIQTFIMACMHRQIDKIGHIDQSEQTGVEDG
ncbi:tRNA (adenosine(37)-N6)-dimethylallyltransferase MiaA [Mariprofundus sp. EBB-1]|uniref:tRNA (adenosine(37)-N6)-dimethylallyltransferase MiaA n=1 Tax=Mariprofundus sp. EBB-1 TaxID=2650971 RepID=UPI000EF26F8C|nr:tRNA (adenosine(37)-N6)-dimethylallyltransferase MiaA [Mariprofundus sp. EBB-1]RLL55518.1 tRNA (adenosine(37)-N6)-dimethylallyltransferase MiaA [Mariprofundus sp. EBB-1]